MFLVPMRLGVTPVLIPNTMVKTYTADGTMLETAWESRWVPDHGGVAQLGEHLPCKQGVRGSNPLISTVERNEGMNSLRNSSPRRKVRGAEKSSASLRLALVICFANDCCYHQFATQT